MYFDDKFIVFHVLNRYRQIKKQEENTVNPPFDLIEAAEDNIPESDKTEEQKKVEEQRDPLYQITPAMKNVMKRTRYNKFKKRYVLLNTNYLPI